MNYRYKGFISYNSKDAEIAEKLQRYLEHPEMLGIKEKIGAFFRDRSDLTAGDVLDEAIKVSLEESEWLIIVCSPNVTNYNTSGSIWVDRECDYFINHLGRTENSILLISPDSPKDSDIFALIPKPVLSFQDRLAADARENKDGWHNALIKICSKLLNKSFRELLVTYTIYNAFQSYLLSTREVSRLISAKKYEDAEEKLLALVTENQSLDFRNIEWRYLLSQCNKDIGCYFFNGYVTSAAVQWESKYILLGTSEGFIYVFEALTGNKIYEGKAHEGVVENTLFKSETEFVTSGKDNYIKVWLLDKELPVHTFYKKPDLFPYFPEAFREFYTMNKTSAVNLNVEGLKIARVTGSTVTIWDIPNGNSTVLPIPEFKFDKIRQAIDNWHSLAFNKDNATAVFICCYDEILGWDISTLSLFVRHKASEGELFLGFSSDGKLVVKRIGETSIQICDVINCEEFSKVLNNEVFEMDFVKCEKNDNAYNLVMLHKRSGICVWTIYKGEIVERKPVIFDTGHIVPGAVCIKKDSIIYVEKNKHNKVVLEHLNSKPFFMENIFDIEISSDKRYSFLAAGYPEKLILLALDGLETITAFSETYMADICFDVDVKRQLCVTAGTGKQSIDIYNFYGIHLNTIPVENHYESALLKLIRVYCTKIIVCENSWIIAGCSDSSIRIFNYNDKKPIKVIKEHKGQIKFLLLNKLNNKIISIDEKRKIVLWQAGESLELVCDTVEEEVIGSVEFLSNDIICIGTNNGMIKLYDLKLKPVEKWTADNSAIISMQATSDGKRLISVSENGSIKIWCTKSYEEVLFINNIENAKKVVLSHSEEKFLVLTKDYKLYAIDLISGEVKTKEGVEAWKNSRRQYILNSDF